MNLNLQKIFTDWNEQVDLARTYFDQHNYTEAYAIIIDRVFTTFELFNIGDGEPIFMYNEQEGIWDKKGAEYLRQIFDKVLPNSSKNQKAEMLDKISIRSRMDSQAVEPVKNIIVLRNTAFNLEDCKPVPFNDVYFKKNKFDIQYNPEATCPEFNTFLNYFLPDEEDQTAVLEVLAWTLFDYAYFLRKFVVFYGEGGSGKSTLLNVFKAFIGSDNISSIPIQHLNRNFTIGDLYGKLANICDELSSNAVYDLSVLKNLTGDSFIGADRKYQSRITFNNIAKMIYACNIRPELKEDTTAIWDRLYPIEFKVVLPEADRNPNYLTSLTTPEEMSGLLNKVLQAYYTLMKQGHFTYEKSGVEKRSTYLLNTNILPLFCADCLLEEAGEVIEKHDLWTNICRYARVRNAKAPTLRYISEHLPEYLYTFSGRKQLEKKRKSVWFNIRYTDDIDEIISGYEQLGVGNE